MGTTKGTKFYVARRAWRKIGKAGNDLADHEKTVRVPQTTARILESACGYLATALGRISGC